MEHDLLERCSELGEIREPSAQAKFLSLNPQLLQLRTVEELAEAVRSIIRVDVRKAIALAEAALVIAQELGVDNALARALRARANTMWMTGECKIAVDLFAKAAVLFEQASEMGEVGRTLSSSIQALSLLGEYDKAYAAAARAREIFLALGENWRIARLDINLANIYHRQNRYSDAFHAYERAYRQLLPLGDMEGVGVALHNMAVCLTALDNYPKALRAYEQVREFCQQHEMPLLAAQADYNIAYLHYLRGDYTRSLELLRSTREVCRITEDTYHLGLCDLDQSEIYLELKLVAEAAEMARTSLAHFEQLGMRYESIRATANLAIAVSLQGNSQQALELFAKAKDIARGENNLVWVYLIDLYQTIVLLDRNDLSGARDLCSRAVTFFASAEIPSKHVFGLLLLVRIFLRTGNIETARERCAEALHLLESLDSPILLHQARFLQGQVHEALGELEQAYSSYQDSRDALEALRSSLQKEELKIGFMRSRGEVYARMIQLCLDRGDESAAEEAFSHIESAKSRTLRDLIFQGPQSASAESGTAPPDVEIRELREELNWYYHRIEREELSQSGFNREQTRALISEANQRERKLLRALLEASPSATVGAALRNSTAVSLEEIRSVLGKDSALIEYFAIGDNLHAAVATDKCLNFAEIAPARTIARASRLLKFQLSKAHLGATHKMRFADALLRSVHSHLGDLYQILISPLERFLTRSNLVVVPYGTLHSLPFHAFFDGTRYLIDRFRICYSPSASIFAHPGSPRVDVARSLILGVDDPALAFLREEVEAVAAVVPHPEVLVGAEATEQALREKGQRSRLIHIASHGYFRKDSPMFSGIRLADSYVNLYDFYQMELCADLLTLSGCVTGLNTIEDGDELLGLTRGLLYAGAQSLLLTLWEVDDRSTAEFMKEFYSQMQGERPKIDALRNAMKELRERYPHPYHWAPFKLIGRASSLYMTEMTG